MEQRERCINNKMNKKDKTSIVQQDKQEITQKRKQLKSVQEVIDDIKDRQINNKGRLYFDGLNPEVVIHRIEQVWSFGGTDREASFYSQIEPMTLNRLLEEYPILILRKHEHLTKPILKSRETIIKDLETVDTAKWYLERKLPDEFGNKQKIDTDMNLVIEIKHFTDDKKDNEKIVIDSKAQD